ncbi:MAG: hypothetical protein L0Y72_30565 [Gemmataceae bacterium]|nr:hypothetical protein [Gemmataceae bacterium]MCI0743391.1 hypothetical protein [Gemmataceae bacterium]
MTSTKTILGLVVLLGWPCLGLGSRADAGFVVGTSIEAVEGDQSSSWEWVVRSFRRSDDNAPRRQAPEWTGSSVPQDTLPPGTPVPTRGPRLANPDGEGCHSNAPSGPNGPSLVMNVNSRPALAQPTRVGLLFLSDSPYQPDPPGSRLFRPPRS